MDDIDIETVREEISDYYNAIDEGMSGQFDADLAVQTIEIMARKLGVDL